jgi:hypothetical protein
MFRVRSAWSVRGADLASYWRVEASGKRELRCRGWIRRWAADGFLNAEHAEDAERSQNLDGRLRELSGLCVEISV